MQIEIEVEQSQSAFDAGRIREDFPMLETRVHGKPIVYLDNAASSLKPSAMIDRLEHFYSTQFANTNEENSLSQAATEAVQQVRSSVAEFFRASSPEEMIFVRNATEAINLVAYGFGRSVLQRGDEVLITSMEHDSNVLPWQIACETSGARLRVAAVEASGALDLQRFEQNISDRTKVVAGVQCVWDDLPGSGDRYDGAPAEHSGAGRWRAKRPASAHQFAGDWVRVLCHVSA
jgi:cysteine desulfurase/selenocysteine lyase